MENYNTNQELRPTSKSNERKSVIGNIIQIMKVLFFV